MKYLTAACCILLLASAAPRSRAEGTNSWQPELVLGFNLTEGNSSTTALNLGFQADRLMGPHEVKFDGEYNHGEADDQRNVENGRTTLDYNYQFTRRMYANLKAEWSYDDIAGLDYRVIVGPPSLGYYLLQDEVKALALEVGLAYLWEKKAGTRDDGPVFRFKQSYEHQFNDYVRLTQFVEYLPNADAWEDYLLRFEAAVDSSLTERLALRVAFQDRYDSAPAAGKEENDIFLTTGLVLKL